MRHWIRKLANDEAGVTAIEYAVMLSIIAVFMVGALALFGNTLAGAFNTLSNTFGAN